MAKNEPAEKPVKDLEDVLEALKRIEVAMAKPEHGVDNASVVSIVQRLEAKVDQVLGDNKALQQEVTELKTWVQRMARQAKARA